MAYQYSLSWTDIPDNMVEEETYSCDHTMCNRSDCKDCYPDKAHYCHVEGTPNVGATITTASSVTIDKDYFQSIQEEYGKKEGIREFETGAVRDSNKGKPLIHTLLGYTRQRFGYHMAKNADKYGPFNFLKGIPTEAALESLDRHLAAYMAGDRSEDHLSAIIFGVQCCMLNEQKDGVEANEYFNG